MTKDEQYEYWLQFHRFQQSREKYFAPKFNQALKEQIQQFLRSYTRSAPAIALLKVNSEPLLKVLRPLYIDAAKTYGAKVRARLNRIPLTLKARAPIGFNARMTALVLQYFSVDFLNDVEEMTAYTRELIQKVLSDAAEQGWGYDEIVKTLESTAMTKVRSRRIARTETVTASNWAADQVAKDSGLMLNKVWLSVKDKRTRHDHILVDGQTVGLNDFFNVGGYQMRFPGDRGGKNGQAKTPAKEVVNCRCVAAHEPLRDSNGRLIRTA